MDDVERLSGEDTGLGASIAQGWAAEILNNIWMQHQSEKAAFPEASKAVAAVEGDDTAQVHAGLETIFRKFNNWEMQLREQYITNIVQSAVVNKLPHLLEQANLVLDETSELDERLVILLTFTRRATALFTDMRLTVAMSKLNGVNAKITSRNWVQAFVSAAQGHLQQVSDATAAANDAVAAYAQRGEAASLAHSPTLVLLEQVLAEIHDSTDRWLSHR